MRCNLHLNFTGKTMKRLLSLFVFAIAVSIAAHAQTPFTVNDLLAMKRVTDPQLSPDGKTVAFTIGIVDKAANRTSTRSI